MTQKKAEILLAAVIAARATSLLFSKIAMNGMGIFNLLAVLTVARLLEKA